MSGENSVGVVVDPLSSDEDESEVQPERDPAHKRAEEEGEKGDLPLVRQAHIGSVKNAQSP